jgi:hypothetical protein
MSSNPNRVVSLFEANVYSFDFVCFLFHFSTSKMPLHFIQLKLGKKAYKAKVSTEDCSDVAEFRSAIKKISPDLDSYAPHHLTLFQPD